MQGRPGLRRRSGCRHRSAPPAGPWAARRSRAGRRGERNLRVSRGSSLSRTGRFGRVIQRRVAFSRATLADELGQLRDDLVQVADDAEVRVLEDRRVRVFVDRDDDPGGLHAHLVLDRTGDSARDVELRRDRLAGLADLSRVRVPTGVDHCARRRDGTAERLRQLLDELEVLRRAEAAAAGHDHVGIFDRRPLALGMCPLDHRRCRRKVLELGVDLFDLGLPAGLLWIEGSGADQSEPRLRAPADVHEDRVAERRALADQDAVLLDEVGEVRLQAGLNWDLTDLVQEDGILIGKRPALGDSVFVDVGWRSEPRLALIRAGTFDPQETGGEAEVEDVEAQFEDFSTAATMVERAHAESEGPSIEDADVIVAGGRGLGAPENFKLVEELAQALGGAVAATRAVVDAGWYPYSTQVGQTGKTVPPKLYIACGISGAIQHKVGMQSSGVIVAINKDPNAPIFEYSDLGVVGDLNEIVPKLTELVRQRRS